MKKLLPLLLFAGIGYLIYNEFIKEKKETPTHMSAEVQALMTAIETDNQYRVKWGDGNIVFYPLASRQWLLDSSIKFI